MNRDNLKKLADYLDTLPTDYTGFAMEHYYRLNKNFTDIWDAARWMETASEPECGSVACALGHGPAAGIKMKLAPTALNDLYTSEMWSIYCLEAFGVVWGKGVAEWMFGGDWACCDNTAKGAAARIRYVLDGGFVKDDFDSFEDVRKADEEDRQQFIATYEEYLK